MTKYIPIDLRRFWCRNCVLFLAFLWIVSIWIGMLIAAAADTQIAPLMCSAACCPVSIVGLAAVLFFPLFASAFVVHYHTTELILLLCSIKGFFLGYCLYGVLLAFGSGGWLMACLFLFSSLFMQVVLFWFWQSTIAENAVKQKVLLIGAGVATAIGMFDYFCVSPFLKLLISKL